MKPLFQHDCEACTFLGTVANSDLYFCNQSVGGPTVICRYGDDGPQYNSGLCFSKTDIFLREAAMRSIKRGLLTMQQWVDKTT